MKSLTLLILLAAAKSALITITLGTAATSETGTKSLKGS